MILYWIYSVGIYIQIKYYSDCKVPRNSTTKGQLNRCTYRRLSSCRFMCINKRTFICTLILTHPVMVDLIQKKARSSLNIWFYLSFSPAYYACITGQHLNSRAWWFFLQKREIKYFRVHVCIYIYTFMHRLACALVQYISRSVEDIRTSRLYRCIYCSLRVKICLHTYI